MLRCKGPSVWVRESTNPVKSIMYDLGAEPTQRSLVTGVARALVRRWQAAHR
jgi:hypothetical protein